MRICSDRKSIPGYLCFGLIIALGSFGCSSKGIGPGEAPGPCAAQQACAAIESDIDLAYPPTLDTAWSVSGNLNTYSSPKAADLNGDCIDDIVVGHGDEGGPESGFGVGYVTAHDGATGEILWSIGPDFEGSISLYELVGTPTLVDLSGDGTADVVIGGREAALIAINGATGERLWQFYPDGGAREDGWYNFYTTQAVDDLNDDNIPDLVSANGGDATVAPFGERDAGHLMILSGADGTIISSAPTPDSMETYMSPIVYTPEAGGPTYVLFGTGGETFAGSLWRVSLSDLLTGDISNAQKLTTPRSHKGVIAPPSLADVNVDGVDDIVVVTFDGQVVALDGLSGNEIWHYEPSGYGDDDIESYVTPSVGYFNSDGVPDVFLTLSIGTWPQYTGSLQIALSGWDGSIILKEESSSPGFPSPVAADLNGDTIDEVLLVVPDFYNQSTTLTIFDFASDDTFEYEWDVVGAGTPLVTDLDHDGVLELVGCYSTGMMEGGNWNLFRKTLNAAATGTPSWGGYLGSLSDGSFRNGCTEAQPSAP